MLVGLVEQVTTHPTLPEIENSPSTCDGFKIGLNHVMCVIALINPTMSWFTEYFIKYLSHVLPLYFPLYFPGKGKVPVRMMVNARKAMDVRIGHDKVVERIEFYLVVGSCF